MEYEVIEELKENSPVRFLCGIIDVNPSGYYKWRKRKSKPNRYEQDRMVLTELLQIEHYLVIAFN